MARPTQLSDPERCKEIAEAFVAGCTRVEMTEMFGVKDVDTITRWRRDPRVKGYALKLIEDRVLQVTRKVDAVISQRLQNAEEMTTKELLEVRKEYLGGSLRQQHEKADDDTINDAMTWLDENPEAAGELEAMLEGKKPNPVAVQE
jgi:transposase